LATQKIDPEQAFVERQHHHQRGRMHNRKLGALAFAALIGLVAVVVVIRAADDGTGAQPTVQPTPTGTRGVTVVLRPTSDDRCCLVTTVNPGASPTIVLCFVEVFDEAGRLLSTHLVPPIPPGHRRSSGFQASPGREDQGFQSFPLELLGQRYASTCRPAAWHGGAPI